MNYVKLLLSFFFTLIVVYIVNTQVFSLYVPAVCVTSSIMVKTLVFTLTLFIFVYTNKYPVSFGLLLAGGFFGIVELSVSGCIRDYINFFLLFKFNVSDLFIALGAVGIFVSLVKDLMRRR